MTVKIVNLKPQKITIPISFIVAGKNGKIVDTQLANRTRDKLKRTTTRHYRNVLRQLGNAFASPSILSGTHGGHRIIPVKDGEGKNRRIRTTNWHPLSDNYAASSPRSTRVWKKRRANGLSASYNRGVNIKSKKTSVKRSGVKKASRKDTVRVHYIIKFDKLHQTSTVLNSLIAAPFVYGRESLARGFTKPGIRRNTSELMFFPEKASRVKDRRRKSHYPANRPFVVRLSSRLGKEMNHAIRKL